MKPIPSMAQRAAQKKWSGRTDEEKKQSLLKRQQKKKG